MSNIPPILEILLFLVVVLFIMFSPMILKFVFFRIFSDGKSNKKYLRNKTIIPIYVPPKDLSAAELGTLFDRKSGRLEYLATLYELKNRKIISIDNSSSDEISIKLLKYQGEKLKKYEDLLLRYFFNKEKDIKLHEYTQGINFSTTKGYFDFLVLQELQDNAYLKPTSGYSNKTYYEYLNDFYNKGKKNPFSMSFKIIKYFFLGYENDLTQKAKESLQELEGFKYYIETAELDKIKFHAVGDLNQYIEKLTPYAIAFNQMERWQVLNIPSIVIIEPTNPQIQNISDEAQFDLIIEDTLKSVKDLDKYKVVS